MLNLTAFSKQGPGKVTDLSSFLSVPRDTNSASHTFLWLLLFLLLTCFPSPFLSVIVHRCLVDPGLNFSSAMRYLYDLEKAVLIPVPELS